MARGGISQSSPTWRVRKVETVRHAMINGRLKVTILRCLRGVGVWLYVSENLPYCTLPRKKKGGVARTIFATVQKQIQYVVIYHNFFFKFARNYARSYRYGFLTVYGASGIINPLLIIYLDENI